MFTDNFDQDIIAEVQSGLAERRKTVAGNLVLLVDRKQKHALLQDKLAQMILTLSQQIQHTRCYVLFTKR